MSPSPATYDPLGQTFFFNVTLASGLIFEEQALAGFASWRFSLPNWTRLAKGASFSF